METKCGQDLKEMLVELYEYYWKQVKKAKTEINEMRYTGSLDTVGVIFLNLYGGKELFELWKKQIENDLEGMRHDKTTGD